MQKNITHWTQVQENGTVLGIKILLFIYRLFGRTVFSVILLPVMAYYYLTNKTARHSSQQYLSYLKPFLSPDQFSQLNSFKHFISFGNMLLDKLLVWMGRITPDAIVFETPSVVDSIKASGQGALIVVSHLGNIEVCNALRQKLDEVKLTILVNTEHAEKINSLMQQLDSNSHAELLQVNDLSPATAIMLAERVARGELIVIAGDRTPEHVGRISKVDFLGKPAHLPQGAFILASLLKCPVYLLFCLKQRKNYHIYVEKFSEQLKFARKERQQQLDLVVQNYANRLQHYCIKAPLQWFNFFPFWLSDNKTPK
ncbi:lipid A biosynthesis acyltransferase [Aliiglaciecola sp. 3_MG-2023]|uniref:LpxL/LpxP family acyltransferase n=1 Tax=Aliiglaciecola sp. 3_MG-2023 TaxID=3062644 RepID=UPI0026E1D8BF|nr:lipid A biosynthesis acyltransferase [Aliiglaciecola sp. 3_MG-2023]MDO6695053.1 lipid A biosynthesis acyltransferase [Aliiglaciecola sp. 3_MG-2023]